MDLYKLFWVVIADFCGALPVFFIRKYNENIEKHQYYLIIISIISYLFLIYAYTIILNDNNIATMYTRVKVISILIVVFFGVIVYNNKLQLKSYLGIILGIAAVYLLSSKKSLPVHNLQITEGAKSVFVKYINSHKKAKTHEAKCSKIKDITGNIYDYFNIELSEKEHSDVVKMIKKNNGIMTKTMMKRWIKENYRENYVENETRCDS
jgi:multidrug transporter EmrE-like cation transporter